MKTSYSTLYKCLFISPFNSAIKIVILSSLMVGTSAMAAVDSETMKTTPSVDLLKITVTATRIPTATNNTIAQTRVIDSEELKSYQGQTVLDVIKRQPGFSSFSNGGMGTSGNLYMRGYDKKSILVLIDGVRYSSLSSGGAALSLLPADQIERIEVLYGASGSSMYGADAVGGVIQIFTKGANIDDSQFSVTAGAGSHDHYLYGATAQLSNDKGTRLSLSASHNETDGFSTVAPDGYGYNGDDDGFESDNYSLHLDQKVNDSITIGASGLYSDSTTDIDSTDDWQTGAKALNNSHANQKNGAGNAYIQYQTNQQTTKLAYGYSVDKSETYENETHLGNPSEYNTKQQQIDLTGDYHLPVGTAVYGIEHLKQELDSNVYDADERKVTSGFAGYVFSNNKIDAQANIRYDDYSDFDSETTYNLGAAYRLTPEFRVGANYAKGYRVPDFTSLYYPGSGNPDLDPETSDNYEAFIEYSSQLQSTRITGYKNKVDDLIAWSGSTNENINKAKIKGVTLTSDWNIKDYLFGLSYDYQKAEDDSGKDNDGTYLPIRPENKGSVYVGYQLSDLSVRAEYQYVDDYYYYAGNKNKVDSYNLVNISGNYQLAPNLSLSAQLNNVFNEKYETSPGYNTDGTNFFTSLTYTFK